MSSYQDDSTLIEEKNGSAPYAASILVVDDNPLIVDVLRGLLRAQNYKVFTSKNGKEAAELLTTKTVDVIICDVMMPKSYLSSEPGAQRAFANKFDPYYQTYNRLCAYAGIGHPTDKIELIILGGTWSVYPKEYQISDGYSNILATFYY